MEETFQVQAVLNLHFNQIDTKRDGTARFSRTGVPIFKAWTLYIPEKVDIDGVLEGNPPNFAYHRDCFVYILHLISAIRINEEEEENGYTRISSVLLQKKVKDYKSYLEYLIECGIIETDNHYITGEKCIGYRFTNDYVSELKPVEITKQTLIKSIVYNVPHNFEKICEDSFMRIWFDDLEVDLEGAKGALRELFNAEKELIGESPAWRNYNARLLPILKLSQGDILFFVDNTSNRLHTNLTQVKSELRKFIKFKGEKLCAIDISNSQPYMALALLNEESYNRNDMDDKINNPSIENKSDIINLIKELENNEDVVLFKNLVTQGKFYEHFAKEMIIKGLIPNVQQTDAETLKSVRNKAKDVMFTVLFSSNRTKNDEAKLFKEKFPNVHEIFKLIKRGDKTYNTLAICLQKLESELVLEKACVRINSENPNVPIFTLHDSIITTEEHVEYVEAVLKEILTNNIGEVPNLKLERWE
ncbi:hypothetical protein [Myroides sp. DW712]|uniref:hypothetical protein n=1 Tax=Myroides sp. DW712 TaxID=3389800 RepID=UPI0039786090